MSIKIPISAELNQQDISAQIKQVQDAFNSLGQTAAKAGRIKFEPIDKLSLDQAQKMRKEFETMVRISPGLRKSLDGAKQTGRSFDQVDWDTVWADPKQRASHAQTMVSHLGPDQIQGLLDTPPSPGGVPNQPRKEPKGGGGRRALTGAAAGLAGGVASQVGGLAGGVASGALSGGLAGGPIGAVLGAFTGALSSILGVMGQARDVAISLDTLKRQLGDTGVGFNDLKVSTRDLSDRFALTDDQAVALTQRYASQSGAGSDVSGLRNEVAVGVGFSRSYGLDPSQGVDFFAQMRGMGITKDADDSKRLALSIGEAVARAGQFSRMGEVLGSLSHFMENSARTSFSGAGASDWLSRYAGLQNTELAGMTPSSAASIIGGIDASIRAGGTSTASKNFMSSVLMSREGINPVQAQVQLEGGAFASGRSTFGAGSAMGGFYAQFGGGSRVANWFDDRTNISMLQGVIQQKYAGHPDLMLDAFSNTFGISRRQSAAWLQSTPERTDAMAKRLDRLGIGISKVDETGISRISQIEADKKLSDAQKDAAVRQAATEHQVKTEGTDARDAMVAGSNAMLRLADQGLPMLSDIQSGILKMAGLDPKSLTIQMADEAHKKRLSAIDEHEMADVAAARKRVHDTTPAWKQLLGPEHIDFTPDQKAARSQLDTALDALRKAQDADKAQYEQEKSGSSLIPGTDMPSKLFGKVTDSVLQQTLREDKKYGFEEGTTAGLMKQESEFNSNAKSGVGAAGLFQITPQNVATLSKEAGRQLDPTNTQDAFYMYERLMDGLQKKYGTDTVKMLRGYHGGNEDNWGPVNADYVPAIHRQMKSMDSQLAAAKQTFEHNINVGVTVADQQGNSYPTQAVTTSVAAPQASGSGH